MVSTRKTIDILGIAVSSSRQTNQNHGTINYSQQLFTTAVHN
ncbi:MAG: hypothetical protein ACTS8Y_00920 [Arsenophonus sp. ER-EMS1-MAG3]